MKRSKYELYLKKVENDTRWVIPNNDVRWHHNDVVNREPIKYWLVELTLTSGDVRSFYVKAKTFYDAELKARDNFYRVFLKQNGTRLILVD